MGPTCPSCGKPTVTSALSWPKAMPCAKCYLKLPYEPADIGITFFKPLDLSAWPGPSMLPWSKPLADYSVGIHAHHDHPKVRDRLAEMASDPGVRLAGERFMEAWGKAEKDSA